MSQFSTSGRLHCPKCKSRNLVATSEAGKTEGSAMSSRVSKNEVMTTYSSKTFTRNFWLCRDCGHKFRNIENLEQELYMEEKQLKGSVIVMGLGGLLIAIALVLMISKGILGAMIGIFPLLFGILFLAIGFFLNRSKKKTVASLKNRIEYLKVSCFQ